ncbi:pullulanase-type alpha-1,6-glucosidase [Haloglycomyces albus]|uniref:pullulanase-type alpha-1,6-glucosidase n=1 Tax=Haloglycomyces albus TaxID=526067 RepID=UPI00046CCB09|nr:pullulanase-type alpha-1,6-glucosidase [Haloglycomyces albus]
MRRIGRYTAGALTAVLALTACNEPDKDDDPQAEPSPLGDVLWSSEPTDSQLAQLAQQETHPSEQFYFILTDRFADAKSDNNTGGIDGGALDHGYDPTSEQFYHGGDLAGVEENLDYIEGLGTTALWLTPIVVNAPVQSSEEWTGAGYHGYWGLDFLQVDPHLGTMDELQSLIDSAHDREMKVYFDIVVNHTADVIEYSDGDNSYISKEDSPYTDSSGRPFDDAEYADGDEFPDVNSDSFPHSPVVPEGKENLKNPEWLNDVTNYHNRGDSTWTGESVTYGDFVGLDDVWTERPGVVDGWVDVYSEWISSFGIDGFRIDTVKHANMEFWPRFMSGISEAAETAGIDFFSFGEVYSGDPRETSPYVRQGKLDGVLDFGFQANASSFALGTDSGDGLAELYTHDSLFTARDTDARNLPTFLSNHDMGRLGLSITSDTPEHEWVDRSVLAHQLMFLTRGQPVVYYGDEQGFVGHGGDDASRQSLFASQVSEWDNLPLIGTDSTHAQDNYDTTHPLYEAIAELGQLRGDHPALSDGIQVTRSAGDGVFAFSRFDPSSGREYLVVSSNASSSKTLTLETDSESFEAIYGSADISMDGTNATVTLDGRDSVVLRAEGTTNTEGDPTIQLDLAEESASIAHIDADAGGDRLTKVAYAATVDGENWFYLGTAPGPQEAIAFDLNGLSGGTELTVKGVAVNRHGDTASNQATTIVATPDQPGDSPGHATVHFNGDAEKWGLYVWGDVADESSRSWPDSIPFNAETDWGSFATVHLAPDASNVGFLVIDENGNKLVESDREFNPSENNEIWLFDDSEEVATSPPSDWTVPGEDDPNTAVLHYQRDDGDYDGWEAHVWTGAANPTEWDDGIAPTTVDRFGAVFEIPLADGADGLSYILHRGDEKDLPDDQYLDFSEYGTEVWLTESTPGYLYPGSGSAGDSSNELDLTQQRAYWLDDTTVALPDRETDGKVYRLHSSTDGTMSASDGSVEGAEESHEMVALGGMPERLRQRFPHLWDYQVFQVEADARALARTQLAVTEERHDGDVLNATGIQIAGLLDDLYAESAAATELGVTWTNKKPTLSVWAPTAREVELELYDTPEAEPTIHAMDYDSDSGVWSVNGKKSWDRSYYRFRVDVWQPAIGDFDTASVTDPYAVSLATDSTHSQIVNLDDADLKPDGWDEYDKPDAVDLTATHVWEVQVRDFSIADASVDEELRGTYLAFTQDDSTSVQHLKELAEAGLTHVHLQPTFDIATIPEGESSTVDCDLEQFAADSPQQQECVGDVRGDDAYNWGYDPYHFNAVEGSYATDPQGTQRILEYRRMVKALNDLGLRVAVDVVYNHTSASGTDATSVFDRIVPGYYHRLDETGAVTTSTCCANTAPEHAMFDKFIVDSVTTWAEAYRVDAFRFDLMGHHPKSNMLAVKEAVEAVDDDILVYGEGWNFGEVADNARFEQATQPNMGDTGIATFNDRLRDAARGGGPFDDDPTIPGWGSGMDPDSSGHATDLVKLGLIGNLANYELVTHDGTTALGSEIDYNGQPAGYAEQPDEVVNYVDAHDNEILFDALAYKLDETTSSTDRARAQLLNLATTLFSQGASLNTAGTEILRSKSLDRDSYDSGDWFNAIRWNCWNDESVDGFGSSTNGFPGGLPPAWTSEHHWDYAEDTLNAVATPDCDDIALAHGKYLELLRVASSTEAFSLGDAEEIADRISFPELEGTDNPGAIAMSIDLDGLDDRFNRVVVVFNNDTGDLSADLDGWGGSDLELHPALADSVDADMAQADFTDGAVTVPGLNVAVFVG